MTRAKQAGTFAALGGLFLVPAFGQGASEITIVQGFASTTCGSAWEPDLGDVTAAGVQQCSALATSHNILAGVFLLCSMLCLLGMVYLAVVPSSRA